MPQLSAICAAPGTPQHAHVTLLVTALVAALAAAQQAAATIGNSYFGLPANPQAAVDTPRWSVNLCQLVQEVSPLRRHHFALR